MVPSLLKLLVAGLPLAHATLPLNNPLGKRADPYPFCSPSTNPNCIDGGRYLVPILEFSNRDDKGDSAYQKYLPNRTWTTSKLVNVWPSTCKYWAVDADKFSAADFDVYNVTFSDGCANKPWVVCYHKRSPNTLTQVLNWVGKIPVGMRQSVSTYLVYSTDNPNYNGVIATLAGDGIIIGRSDYYFPTALVHEHGHAVDSNLVGDCNGGPFSATNNWKSAYNNDYCAVSAYGAGSGVEDFAEAGRAVLLDNIYPGGLKAFSNNNPNLTQITNQLVVARNRLGDYYKPTTACDPTKKFPYPNLIKQV